MVSSDYVITIAMAMLDGEWGVVDNMLLEVDDEHVGDVLEVAWIAQGMLLADAESDFLDFVVDNEISIRYNTSKYPAWMTDGVIH